MSTTKKMKTISIMWGMIIFGLLVIMITFSVFYKIRIKKYQSLENELKDVTKSYIEDNNLYPVEGTEVRIELKDLQNEDLIDDLKVKKDTCDGYVIVKNDGNYKYSPYIKCKIYVTNGFKKAK